jgi:hypothetical protein
MRFHRWQFLAERIGWCAMFAVLVFALIGGFGRGLLSRATAATDDDSLRVDYERFGRHNASCELRFRFAPKLAGDILLRFNREFIKNVRIETFTPQSDDSHTAAEGVTYRFKGDEGGGERSIEMHYLPKRVGPMPCRITINDSQEVEFNQFIYP